MTPVFHRGACLRTIAASYLVSSGGSLSFSPHVSDSVIGIIIQEAPLP